MSVTFRLSDNDAEALTLIMRAALARERFDRETLTIAGYAPIVHADTIGNLNRIVNYIETVRQS